MHRSPSAHAQTLPFTNRLSVRFRDMDGFAHVNHSVYFTYLEVARTEYWFQMMDTTDMNSFNFIVMKASCQYRSPAVLGEVMLIHSGITRFGNSSFTWEYEIFDEKSGRHIATAATELVMYDYERKRPTRIPAELRDRITRFQESLIKD